MATRMRPKDLRVWSMKTHFHLTTRPWTHLKVESFKLLFRYYLKCSSLVPVKKSWS